MEPLRSHMGADWVSAYPIYGTCHLVDLISKKQIFLIWSPRSKYFWSDLQDANIFFPNICRPTLNWRDSWRCWNWFQKSLPPPGCLASAWITSQAGRERSEKVQLGFQTNLFQMKKWRIEEVLTMPPRQEKVPIINRGMILFIAPWWK